MGYKIFIGISAPESIYLLQGQLRFLNGGGFEVFLLGPDSDEVRDFCLAEGATHIPVPVRRRIALFYDAWCLIRLVRIFKKHRPDIINLGTPKISLLGMMAGYLTRVKVRIYTCRGFRFEHEKGITRKILKFTEKLTVKYAHQVICVSDSLATNGIREGILPAEKVKVISPGSSNGIDLDRFSPEAVGTTRSEEIKARYSVTSHFVFGFIGRLIDRKGINELYESFNWVYARDPNVRLLVAGEAYFDQIRDKTIIQKMEAHPGIIMAGWQDPNDVPAFLSVMDIFVLPAWWEGFGNVLIQAAAMGVPVIATNTTGCVDAVKAGYNGVLVNTRDVSVLSNAMMDLKNDPDQRKTLGQNGQEWAKKFDQNIIWEGQYHLYDAMLKEKGN